MLKKFNFFTVLKLGGFALVLAIVTACGGGGDATEVATPTSAQVTNIVPTANAGPIQNILIGTDVTLDGSGSDANGDILTYSWTLAVPNGSSAKLNSNSSPKPTFTADVAGDYVAKLVVNDGKATSAESSVVVTSTAINAAPVANAGVTQNVMVGAAVILDGTTSSDANGDQISYAWTLTGKPAGSNAVLAEAASPKPSFTADLAGSYVASLIVNDGKINGAESIVTVTSAALNAAPAANAGITQSVSTNTTVTLDGTASSDANGDLLTYSWKFISKPSGSSAELTAATSVKPKFIADLVGIYVVSLTVNDGRVSSAASTVTVAATVANVPPIANAGAPQTVLVGTLVILDGSASSDTNLDRLTYAWNISSRPNGSNAVLISPASVKPNFNADLAGNYVITLIVNDGKVNSSATSIVISANAARYTAIKIELPAGTYGYAEGLNSSGQVVGSYSTFSTQSTYGFVTGIDGGGTSSLPNFSPDRVNSNGIAIGRTIEIGTSNSRGAILDIKSGKISILPTLGGVDTFPRAINDSGWVVGGSYQAGFVTNAFSIAPGASAATLVGPSSGGDINLVSINSSGIAVGNPSPYGTNSQAFVVDTNTGVWMGIGPAGERATAINSTGQVLFERFITDSSRMTATRLGTLGGRTTGLDINSQGVVVGASDLTLSNSHAFVTGRNGIGIFDLNTLTTLPDGVVLYRAVGINDRGQIAVQSTNGNYLLNPTP